MPGCNGDSEGSSSGILDGNLFEDINGTAADIRCSFCDEVGLF